MSDHCLCLPLDFSEYEMEVTANGYFSGAQLIVAEKKYRLNFYDAVRLGQEIERELESSGMFFEANLVIVRSVTKGEMDRAAEQLVRSGLVASLIPE